MSGKGFYLTFGLLLCATAGGALGAEAGFIIDPHLIGWWPFEEGQGPVALDASGHGHHATLIGDPQWVPGYDGLALDLDGQGDYLDTGKLPSQLGIAGSAPRTVALWVYARSFNGGGLYEMGGQGDGEGFSLRTGTSDNEWRLEYGSRGDDFVVDSVNEWVHFTCVYADGDPVYVNGQRVLWAWYRLATTDDATFKIGVSGQAHFDGLIDDVRLYSRALAPDEIAQIMQGDPCRAWNPQPGHGSTVTLDQTGMLCWSAGIDMVAHDIYLGTDATLVKESTIETDGVYRGRQFLEATTYVPLEAPLEWDTTHYWRIDEVGDDGTVTKGPLWRFTILDHLIVDDFESYDYDEDHHMWDTWIDGWVNGTGSLIGYIETICWGPLLVPAGHTGWQAMPFRYDNTVSPWYSEAVRTWETAEDWMRYGVDTLTLHFIGLWYEENDPDVMYVALADEAGNVAVVNHPDPLAVGAATWQRWDIPLSEFVDAGIDVTAIVQMIVGVGDRDNPAPAGNGMVHFDDFWLTRSTAPPPDPTP